MLELGTESLGLHRQRLEETLRTSRAVVVLVVHKGVVQIVVLVAALAAVDVGAVVTSEVETVVVRGQAVDNVVVIDVVVIVQAGVNFAGSVVGQVVSNVLVIDVVVVAIRMHGVVQRDVEVAGDENVLAPREGGEVKVHAIDQHVNLDVDGIELLLELEYRMRCSKKIEKAEHRTR